MALEHGFERNFQQSITISVRCEDSDLLYTKVYIHVNNLSS